jgi:hypothetical protein
MIYEYNEKRTLYRKINQIKYEIDDNSCWNCVSHVKNTYGYPFLFRDNKLWLVHRYVYHMEKGEIPEGFVIMHKCDNRQCMNPDHLVAGTQADNMKDMDQKNRRVITSKLTEDDVCRIKEDPREQRVIAKEYGVHYMTIWHIKNGKTWRNL